MSTKYTETDSSSHPFSSLYHFFHLWTTQLGIIYINMGLLTTDHWEIIVQIKTIRHKNSFVLRWLP